ncbi:SRPBCC family protein [Terrarubrum flagellatum]|uniref:SRPBCC family protein n=1 Tax=Terrirubrum flagellatum TaxID=2895980 RepID=UPI003144E110
MTIASVRKEITVEVTQARAFRVFTEEHGAWWPLATHHIAAKPAETAIIEPFAGGRWFERAADGEICLWGKVLAWEPPTRLVLGWQIGADWKHDPALITEVEIRFVALGPALTRIELEHRDLERFGEAAGTLRGSFDSEGGWAGIMKLYGERASAPV